MGTTKRAIYKVSNGTDFDTIHFETVEELIKGAVQDLSPTGYRKLPSGLIIQWGSATANFINSGGTYIAESNVIFPIAFPSKRVCAIGSPLNLYANFNSAYSYNGNSETGASFKFTSRTGANMNYNWIAIGY
ncbi:MAG: hypothetical protein RR657_05055 [Peptostreptococcaceae bacterium]